jgi:hypothetical protein
MALAERIFIVTCRIFIVALTEGIFNMAFAERIFIIASTARIFLLAFAEREYVLWPNLRCGLHSDNLY